MTYLKSINQKDNENSIHIEDFNENSTNIKIIHLDKDAKHLGKTPPSHGRRNLFIAAGVIFGIAAAVIIGGALTIALAPSMILFGVGVVCVGAGFSLAAASFLLTILGIARKETKKSIEQPLIFQRKISESELHFEPINKKSNIPGNQLAIPRPQIGIPNPHARTCYLNAVTMALFPLKELFKNSELEEFNVITDTYQDPIKHHVRLEDILTRSMNRSKERGDSSILLDHLFHKLTKENSKISKLFHTNIPSYTCPHCSEVTDAEECNWDIIRPADSVHLKKITKISDSAMEAFSGRFDTCEHCRTGEINTPVMLPKYFTFSTSGGMQGKAISLDTPEFSWKGQNFKVLSAIAGGVGHATCILRGEDNNWYKYNDSKVSQVDPSKETDLKVFIIENLSY